MKSKEKYRNIFKNLIDVYFETSIEGTIIELSPSVEHFLKGHLKRDDLIGQSILDLYSEPKKRKAFINLLLKKKTVSDYEIMLKNGDDPAIPCSVSAKLCFDSQTDSEKIIGNIHNISYWKHFENELLGKNFNLRLMLDNTTDAILLIN